MACLKSTHLHQKDKVIVISSDEDEASPSSKKDKSFVSGKCCGKSLTFGKCLQIPLRRYSGAHHSSRDKRIKLDPDIFDAEVSDDDSDWKFSQLEQKGEESIQEHKLDNYGTHSNKVCKGRRRISLRSAPSQPTISQNKMAPPGRRNSMPAPSEYMRTPIKLNLTLDPDIFDNELSSDEEIRLKPVECEYNQDGNSSEDEESVLDIKSFICSDNSIEYDTSKSEQESEFSDSDSDSLPDLDNLLESPPRKQIKRTPTKFFSSPCWSARMKLPTSPCTKASIKKKLNIKSEPINDCPKIECSTSITTSYIKCENHRSIQHLESKLSLGPSSQIFQDGDASSTASGHSSRSGRHFLDVFSSCNSPNCSTSNLLSSVYDQQSTHVAENIMIHSEEIREISKDSSSSSTESVSDGSAEMTDKDSSESDEDTGQCSESEKSKKSKRKHGRRLIHCQTRNSTIIANMQGMGVEKNIHLDLDQAGTDSRHCASYICLHVPRAQPCTVFHSLHHRQICNIFSRTGGRVAKFNEAQITTFHACHEEAEDFTKQTVELVEDFINSQTEPPVEIYKELLKLLLDQESEKSKKHYFRIYNVLKRAQQFHRPTDSVPFEWNDIEIAMQNLRICGGETEAMLGSALALQYMVDMLEDELLCKPLGKQRSIYRSVASSFVSMSLHFDRIRSLLQWIALAVNFGQFESLTASLSTLHIGVCSGSQQVTKRDNKLPPIPKLLPLLQRLLNLSMAVSSKPEEDASSIATELAHEYTRMPDIFHRKLLINSICSELVKMKVGQRILEDNCPNSSNFGCSGNINLEDIILCYFTYEPPTNSFTPPPTPNDDEEDVVEVKKNTRHSSQSCEELAMLHYTVISSYIQCAKGKLTWPLSQRFLRNVLPNGHPLPPQDLETLKSMEAHVESLKSWLSTLTTDLSPRTHLYLQQLLCLADLKC